MAQGMVLVQLRLPRVVYDKLKQGAAAAGISMNRFVIYALRVLKTPRAQTKGR